MRDDMKNITIPENLGEKIDESLAIIRKRETKNGAKDSDYRRQRCGSVCSFSNFLYGESRHGK